MSDVHSGPSPAVAVDVMGGDHAPQPIVDGAVAALRHLSGVVRLIGPREALSAELARHGLAEERALAIVDALEVVAMHE